jgi:imidazolonepropionase-like amidohydrolase
MGRALATSFLPARGSSGHGVPGVPGAVDLDRIEFGAITEAARQRGVKVRAHVANREGIELALDVGVDLIDHGDGLDEALIDRMAEAGTWFAPSMIFPHRAVQTRKGAVVDAMKVAMEAMLETLPKANAAGVRIVLGDDYGSSVLQHGEYGDELDYYVNVVGIPAGDVLRWATRHGAQLMGMGEELGTLKAGAIADLIVIDGDPIADIAFLRDRTNLVAIVKAGSFVKNELACA